MNNKTFSLLETVAILLVVVGHTGPDRLAFVDRFFSLPSYWMVLFVFISGYFFRPMQWAAFPSFLWRKTKRLLLPLLGWNLVYAVLAWVLHGRAVTVYFEQMSAVFSLHNLLVSPLFLMNHQYLLNLAMWFVSSLFFTQLLYALLHCMGGRRSSNLLLLVLFSVVGMLSLALYPHTAGHTHFTDWLMKFPYFLPFFHLGYAWRQEWEARDKIPLWAWFLGLAAPQTLLYFTGNVHYYIIVWSDYQGDVWQPFLCGFIGIFFWLKLCTLLARIPWESRFVRFAGANTWAVMCHHLLVIFLVNWVVVHISCPGADMQAFRTDFWYRASCVPRWLYVALGFLLPLLWQYVFNAAKQWAAAPFSMLKSRWNRMFITHSKPDDAL